MIIKTAHCFFEQSGTFKNAFNSLGIYAIDYDIQNDFGETDVVIDLFVPIDDAFLGKKTLFDSIDSDDLIIAFFPCTYFCDNSALFFMGVSKNQRNLTPTAKIDDILCREAKRHYYYRTLLKLFYVCEQKHLRLIVENPYSGQHFLRNNFPYKPKYVDFNRRLSGDYCTKPTQFFFLNCEPTSYTSIQLDKNKVYTRNRKPSKCAGICSAERSLLSSDYARNFICDKILGLKTIYTQPSLFD